MEIFRIILVCSLVLCALASAIVRSALLTVIIFMSYGLIMTVVWITLQAPDLAITEAAVGAGITSILFFVTLRKINQIRKQRRSDDEEGS
ncbi:MAG: DUF4040 domain-containing protein [Oscillospiraceae bacterium]|nr:DUF4040 domain-containing protein [Oscillospiraceae bacterium]